MQRQTQSSALSPQSFSRFDRTVVLVIGVLVVAILLVIALGDRVGVTLKRVTPLGLAHATTAITVQFDEAMDRPTAESRFRTEPPITGGFSWSGMTMNFKPDAPLNPDAEYMVIIERGARAQSGRETVTEFRYTFTVMQPRVAYLYPADNSPQNIWIVDADDASTAHQLTFSPSGIYDFAVSPDGTKLAFSEYSTNGTMDIKLYDLDTGGLLQLTNCLESTCSTPVWRPDGLMITYERIDFNTGLEGVGSSPVRIWTLDMNTYPPPTRPLFSDLQILGYNGQWSGDGTRIALMDRGTSSVLIYDFTSGEILGIPTTSGTYGAISPDGTRIITSEVLILEGSAARVKMRIVNLTDNSLLDISTGNDSIDEKRVQWRPDGAMLAVSRDDQSLSAGTQIYLVDPTDGSAEMLTDDPLYASTFFYWNPNGTRLVVQRLPLLEGGFTDPLSRPEIWVIDAATGDGVRLAQNGYLPRWIP